MTVYETAYRNGRRELALHCLELLKEYPERKRILSHVFWENACCSEDGIPQYLFYSPAGYRKMNVQSFDELHAPAVESAGGFKRLCVTTNWVLDMASFGCFDGWFAALSDKNRKNSAGCGTPCPNRESGFCLLTARRHSASLNSFMPNSFRNMRQAPRRTTAYGLFIRN